MVSPQNDNSYSYETTVSTEYESSSISEVTSTEYIEENNSMFQNVTMVEDK